MASGFFVRPGMEACVGRSWARLSCRAVRSLLTRRAAGVRQAFGWVLCPAKEFATTGLSAGRNRVRGVGAHCG